KYKTGGNIHQRVMNIDLQGNIYIANNTDSLYSFSKDGELNWKVKYGDGLFPSSVSISPDGNTLYTIASGGKIYALNLNGKIKWEFEVGNVNRPLTVDNAGNIYFLPGTMNGTIISFD